MKRRSRRPSKLAALQAQVDALQRFLVGDKTLEEASAEMRKSLASLRATPSHPGEAAAAHCTALHLIRGSAS